MKKRPIEKVVADGAVIKRYRSVTEAARAEGVCRATVIKYARGQVKGYGVTFRYADVKETKA